MIALHQQQHISQRHNPAQTQKLTGCWLVDKTTLGACSWMVVQQIDRERIGDGVKNNHRPMIRSRGGEGDHRNINKKSFENDRQLKTFKMP